MEQCQPKCDDILKAGYQDDNQVNKESNGIEGRERDKAELEFREEYSGKGETPGKEEKDGSGSKGIQELVLGSFHYFTCS